MNGLVGDYGSDSDGGDEPALAPIQAAPAQPKAPIEAPPKAITPSTNGSDWIECMDNTSGYPYFWNTKTNEVRWDRPPVPPPPIIPPPAIQNAHAPPPTIQNSVPTISQPPVPDVSKPPVRAAAATIQPTQDPGRETISSYPPPAVALQQPVPAVAVEKVKTGPATPKVKSKKAKSSSQDPAAFIGPSLPPIKPEEMAMAKIRQFEEKLATGVCTDLEKEVPPDWVSRDEKRSPMPRPIYSRPFAWRKGAPAAVSAETLAKETHSNPIAMIAGYDSDQEGINHEDKPEAQEKISKNSSRKMIQVRVRSKKSKTGDSQLTPLSQLRPVPSIFRQRNSSGSSRNESGSENDEPRTPEKRQKKSSTAANGSPHIKRAVKGYDTSAGPSYKKSIDQVGEMLCDKLEFLRVDKIEISPLKLLAVQTETIFEAWQSGALSPGYMQKYLTSLSTRLVGIECEHLAPPGWRAVWLRSAKRYEYENLETGETQKEKPVLEEPEKEEEPEVRRGKQKNSEPETVDLCHEDEEELPPLPPEDPPLPMTPAPPPPPPPPPPEDDDQTGDEGDVPTPPPPPEQNNDDSIPLPPPLDDTPPLPQTNDDSIPLPPPLDDTPPLPPLPPAPPMPPPALPSHEVQDMEIDDDDEEEQEEVGEQAQPEQNQVPEDGDHLDGALDSFYADLADLDGNSQGGNSDVTTGANPPSGDTINHPPSVYQSAASSCVPPPPPPGTSGTISQSEVEDGSASRSNSPKIEESSAAATSEAGKRKRKGAKLSQGLLMKKKGVGNLVAKWQNIHESNKF